MECFSGLHKEGKRTPAKQKKSNSTNKDHVFRKRQPQKPTRDNGVVYVNTKTPLKVFLDRCDKLINAGERELTLYCLGAALQRGILLALKLCEKHATFKIHTNTFTSELLDDLEPAIDDADYSIQSRFNSALKIQIIKTHPLDN